MRVALIGITTAINGMETQFNELLVEVEKKKEVMGEATKTQGRSPHF